MDLSKMPASKTTTPKNTISLLESHVVVKGVTMVGSGKNRHAAAKDSAGFRPVHISENLAETHLTSSKGTLHLFGEKIDGHGIHYLLAPVSNSSNLYQLDKRLMPGTRMETVGDVKKEVKKPGYTLVVPHPITNLAQLKELTGLWSGRVGGGRTSTKTNEEREMEAEEKKREQKPGGVLSANYMEVAMIKAGVQKKIEFWVREIPIEANRPSFDSFKEDLLKAIGFTLRFNTSSNMRDEKARFLEKTKSIRNCFWF